MAKSKATSTVEITRANAVALFLALGFQTAKKWDTDRLAKKLNAIEEGPDEALEDDDLDELLDSILASQKVIVVDNGDDDDDAPEEKSKKKGRGKQKKAGKKKTTKKKAAKKSEKKEKRRSIDAATIEHLRSGITIKKLVSALSKEFPDRDKETLERTTKKRLTGYLQKKLGIKIKKSDKGVYKTR